MNEPPTDADKIRNMPEYNSIYQIAQSTAQEHAKGYFHPCVRFELPVVREYETYGRETDDYKNRVPSLKHPEGSAGITYVTDLK